METSILRADVQAFIDSHIGSDVSKLALTKNPFSDIDWITLLSQVSGKTKAREKMPSWFLAQKIIYPSKLSMEQTSSETTAKYKAGLVFGTSLIDLTGGFGVDDYYFSKRIDHVTHCEIDDQLSQIVAHNCKHLQATNIECIPGDSHETLRMAQKKFDWMYIDPSRRHDAKGKVFLLKDCLPNVPGNLDDYFLHASHILIKSSPLLDLSAGLGELTGVKTIHIVAVNNEVKELVWELEKSYLGRIAIKTVNIGHDKLQHFDFDWENDAMASLGLPKQYLYEPNAAIMKSGGFNAICVHYRLEKLHRHSHLYTSNEIVDFPGRTFEVNKILPYTKTAMKTLQEIGKANITVRNFPDTVESIRKKWKIADGGNVFCFFTTDKNDDKIALICTKIEQR